MSLKNIQRFALAAAALTLGLLMAAGAPARAGAPGAGVEADQAADNAPVGPGFARHPLFLKVLARDARGRPLFRPVFAGGAPRGAPRRREAPPRLRPS